MPKKSLGDFVWVRHGRGLYPAFLVVTTNDNDAEENPGMTCIHWQDRNTTEWVPRENVQMGDLNATQEQDSRNPKQRRSSRRRSTSQNTTAIANAVNGNGRRRVDRDSYGDDEDEDNDKQKYDEEEEEEEELEDGSDVERSKQKVVLPVRAKKPKRRLPNLMKKRSPRDIGNIQVVHGDDDDDNVSVLTLATSLQDIVDDLSAVSPPQNAEPRTGVFPSRRRDRRHRTKRQTYRHPGTNTLKGRTTTVSSGPSSKKRGRNSNVNGRGIGALNKRHRVSLGQSTQKTASQTAAPSFSSTRDVFDFDDMTARPDPMASSSLAFHKTDHQDTRNHSRRGTHSIRTFSLEQSQHPPVKQEPPTKRATRRVSHLFNTRNFLKLGGGPRNAAAKEKKSIASSSNDYYYVEPTNTTGIGDLTTDHHKQHQKVDDGKQSNDKPPSPAASNRTPHDDDDDVDNDDDDDDDDGNAFLATFDEENDMEIEIDDEMPTSLSARKEQANEVFGAPDSSVGKQEMPSTSTAASQDENGDETKCILERSADGKLEDKGHDDKAHQAVEALESKQETSLGSNASLAYTAAGNTTDRTGTPNQERLLEPQGNDNDIMVPVSTEESKEMPGEHEDITGDEKASQSSPDSKPESQRIHTHPPESTKTAAMEEESANTIWTQVHPAMPLDAMTGEEVIELKMNSSSDNLDQTKTGEEVIKLKKNPPSNNLDQASSLPAADSFPTTASEERVAVDLDQESRSVTMPEEKEQPLQGNSSFCNESNNNFRSEKTRKLTDQSSSAIAQSPGVSRKPNASCVQSIQHHSETKSERSTVEGKDNKRCLEISKLPSIDDDDDDDSSSSSGVSKARSDTSKGRLHSKMQTAEKVALGDSSTGDDSETINAAAANQKDKTKELKGEIAYETQAQTKSPMTGADGRNETNRIVHKDNQKTRKASTSHSRQPVPKSQDRASNNHKVVQKKLILDLHSDSDSYSDSDQCDAQNFPLKSIVVTNRTSSKSQDRASNNHKVVQKKLILDLHSDSDSYSDSDQCDAQNFPLKSIVVTNRTSSRSQASFASFDSLHAQTSSDDDSSIEILDVDCASTSSTPKHAVKIALEDGIRAARDLLREDFRLITQVFVIADESSTGPTSDASAILKSICALPSLTEVSLSLAGKSIEVKQLMKIFSPQNNIRKLELIDVSLSGHVQDFHVRGKLLTVRELHISRCTVSNRSSRHAFEVWLLEFLAYSPVNTVSLDSCGLSVGCLGKLGQSSQRLELGLRCMHVPHNILSFQNLTNLSLIDCSESCIRDIATAKEQNLVMKEFFLWSRIDHGTAVNFFQVLQSNRAVEKLTMTVTGESDLSELGVDLLLKTNKTLRSLDIVILGAVKNVRRGSTAILKALEKNSHIESLCIFVRKRQTLVEDCSRIDNMLKKNDTIRRLHLLGLEWQALD